MFDIDEIPTALLERVEMIEGLLTARATGLAADTRVYEYLRRELMSDPAIKDLLPSFIRTQRTLNSFWPFIQKAAGTYAERRKIIADAFTPLVDHLEGRSRAPGDAVASNILQTFDAAGVYVVWTKALARREADPEGAITMARTLLETVTKRMLDEVGESYGDADDLPKLYASVATVLNLAPSQHSREPIKAILGSAMNLVNGIGTLRNRMSDAHGRGGRLPVKPSARHANLAVNTAGAVATFLVETHLERDLVP